MFEKAFIKRMSELLGEELDAFVAALSEPESVKAARVNTLKTNSADFLRAIDRPLIPVPYVKDAYILDDAAGIGTTAAHHAGMIYIQDPGAMATAAAVEIEDGWCVLDMCAAPGGKSGQVAEKIKHGFLLSNEYVPKRAKILVSNLERLGVKNATVTSLDTKELPKLYREFFDLVIADVPCSGEGMFRKSEEAVREWSEENVLACARRQRDIIENAASLVKSGGYLLYSTCTFSLEENEMIIDSFLSEHEDYEIVPVTDGVVKCTSDGISFEGAKCKSLHYARRFYPHKSPGEGQFIALLKRKRGDEPKKRILFSDSAKSPSRDEMAAVELFFKKNLTSAPSGRIVKIGENLVILSHGYPIPPHSVFSAGVLLGRVEKGLLHPAHQFFSACGELFSRSEELVCGDVRAEKYLHGEEIDSHNAADGGWCAVKYEGAVIGGGKVSLGKIKNHYPKGLRNN